MVLRVYYSTKAKIIVSFALLSEVSDHLSYQKRVEENVVTFKHFFFLPTRLTQ